MQKRTVAVFFGGNSCEREVSVVTGVFALNVVDKEKYSPVPIYIHADGRMYSSEKMFDLDVFKKKPYAFPEVVILGKELCFLDGKRKKIKRKKVVDVALNCCHGGWGEGGGVAALCENADIPCASPSVLPSAVFLDKGATKLFAKSLGIPVLPYFKISENDYKKRGAFFLKSVGERLKYPVVVKPATLGSSIGVRLCRTEEEAKEAVEAAFAIDEQVLAEKYLEGKSDVNCAAYACRGEIVVSEPEIAAFGDGIYSFADKYEREKSPKQKRELSLEEKGKIRAYTRTLYKRLSLKGVVRADFLLGADEVYLSEVNTVPGSLAYYLFCERITDAKRFFSDLIEEGFSQKRKPVRTASALSSIAATGKRGGIRI